MKVGKSHLAIALSMLVSGSMSFADDRTSNGGGFESDPVLAPSEPITIKRIMYNGTGCPLGTVAENISEDKQAFTLTFSEFFAESGPGISLAQGRKNCVATLTLNIPAGWQYSIANFNYRGFMQLDQGVKATHTVDYSFEGQQNTKRFSSTASGPLEDEYIYTDKIGLESYVWSPCGVSRALNLNTSIRSYNSSPSSYPSARGYIANDAIDGEIKQVFGITWRRCN